MRKLITPEEKYEDPNDFYTEEEVNRYSSNSGMKHTQIQLTQIALELAKLYLNKEHQILDIGCGNGFSIEYLKSLGYKNIDGIDPSREMVKISKQKKLNVRLAGFKDLKRITKKYDFIISISALQWITANKEGLELKNIIKKIGKEIYRILKDKSMSIIQFYPATEEIFIDVYSAFLRVGFSVDKYIYNEESAKKKKYFLILKKKKY